MTAIIPRIGIGRKQRRHYGGSGKQAQQFTHDWILRVKARVRITILVMKRSDWFKIKRAGAQYIDRHKIAKPKKANNATA
jgi:hypothetical protein